MSNYTFKDNETVFLNHKNIVSTIDGDVANNAIPSHELFKNVYDELSAADQTVSAAFVDADKKLSGEFEAHRVTDKIELKTYANSISSELSSTITNKGYVLYNTPEFSYNSDTHVISLTFTTDNSTSEPYVATLDADNFIMNSVISTMQIVEVEDAVTAEKYEVLRIYWKDENSLDSDQLVSAYFVDIELAKLALVYTNGTGISINQDLDGKGRFVISVNNYNTITSNIQQNINDIDTLKTNTNSISSRTLDILNYVNTLSGHQGSIGIIATLDSDIKSAQQDADKISSDVTAIQDYVRSLSTTNGIIQTISVDIDKIEDNAQDLNTRITANKTQIDSIQAYANNLSSTGGTIPTINSNIDKIERDINLISTNVENVTNHADEIQGYINSISGVDGILEQMHDTDTMMSNDINILYHEIRHDIKVAGHLSSLDEAIPTKEEKLSTILNHYNLGIEQNIIQNGSLIEVTLNNVSSEYETLDGLKLYNGDYILIHDHTTVPLIKLAELRVTGNDKNVYVLHTDVNRHEFELRLQDLSSYIDSMITYTVVNSTEERDNLINSRPGDICIVSSYIVPLSDLNHTPIIDDIKYSAFVFDNTKKWKAFNGKYSAADVILNENVLITEDFGHYKFNADGTAPGGSGKGYLEIECAGLSVQEFLSCALAVAKDPELSAPVYVVDLIRRNSAEVGTTFTRPTLTLKGKDGKFLFGPTPTGISALADSGISCISPDGTKTVVELTSNIELAADTRTILTCLATVGNNVYSDNPITYTFNVQLSTSESDAPLNNLDRSVEDLRLSANAETSNVNKQYSCTFTGYRYAFFGGSTKEYTDENLDSDAIRKLATKINTTATTTLNNISCDTPAKLKQIIVAFPKDHYKFNNITILQQTPTLTFELTKLKSSISVEGANKLLATPYDVYVKTMTEAYSAANNMTIKIV